jgi:hypothetical protein
METHLIVKIWYALRKAMKGLMRRIAFQNVEEIAVSLLLDKTEGQDFELFYEDLTNGSLSNFVQSPLVMIGTSVLTLN